MLHRPWYEPQEPDSLPLELRGAEAGPDELFPGHGTGMLPVAPTSVGGLVRNDMQYPGTAMWLRYMPQAMGMKVPGPGSEPEPTPARSHAVEAEKSMVAGAPGGMMTAEGRDKAMADALTNVAGAAAKLAEIRRLESAAREVVALDPSLALPVSLRSGITETQEQPFQAQPIDPVALPMQISGFSANAINVPPGSLMPLTRLAPRTAWRAAEAVRQAAEQEIDAAERGWSGSGTGMMVHTSCLAPSAPAVAAAAAATAAPPGGTRGGLAWSVRRRQCGRSPLGHRRSRLLRPAFVSFL